MKKITEKKVQTGLRVPESIYKTIVNEAQESGMTINSYILSLIHLGRKFVHQSGSGCAHVPAHIDSDNT